MHDEFLKKFVKKKVYVTFIYFFIYTFVTIIFILISFFLDHKSQLRDKLETRFTGYIRETLVTLGLDSKDQKEDEKRKCPPFPSFPSFECHCQHWIETLSVKNIELGRFERFEYQLKFTTMNRELLQEILGESIIGNTRTEFYSTLAHRFTSIRSNFSYPLDSRIDFALLFRQPQLSQRFNLSVRIKIPTR